MARRPTRRTRPAPTADERRSTRKRLLEAAGRVFAEKGFERATGKEICRLAGANAAAVNYYFGGMERLYAEVLAEAQRRLVNYDALSAATATVTRASAKLRAIVELIVGRLTGPVAASWVFRVIGREIIAPSPALESLRRQEFLPRARLIREIVAELMRLPAEHSAVARCCANIMSPFAMLAIADRRMLAAALPSLRIGPEDAADLAEHMYRYAMAGVRAAARAARRPDRNSRR